MHPVTELQRQLGNTIRLGTVAAVDLDGARCRVDTGEVQTDFVPWFVPRAGDTIEWSAPVAGEQGVLLCPGGDTHGAVFLRGVYSDAFPAPDSEAGKHLVRYRDGALIQYDDAAHALTAVLPGGGTVEVTADGGVTINGPLTVNGESTFNGNTQTNGDAGVSKTLTAQTDVVGGGKSLKGHKHTGVSAGSAVSGPPQ